MMLSVICPGIRTQNWVKLYESVKESFSGAFEIIFIGPYELPEELKGIDNVKYIYDIGSPIRCQQIGLIESYGKYITWAADDGYFTKDSLNIAFKSVEGKDNKTIVIGKYREGSGNTDPMTQDWYYYLKNHDSNKVKWIPDGSPLLNVGIVSRETLLEVGGWDAERFEVCPLAYNDLSIRLFKYGCEFILQQEVMFICNHLPGLEGDHGPIHDAQTTADSAAFKQLYWCPNYKDRIKININNYNLSPKRWTRRFGKNKN